MSSFSKSSKGRRFDPGSWPVIAAKVVEKNTAPNDCRLLCRFESNCCYGCVSMEEDCLRTRVIVKYNQETSGRNMRADMAYWRGRKAEIGLIGVHQQHNKHPCTLIGDLEDFGSLDLSTNQLFENFYSSKEEPSETIQKHNGFRIEFAPSLEKILLENIAKNTAFSEEFSDSGKT
ncbi:unnamed protein product [Onchocerca flexuosa]|uniref:DUF4773 domain-containing protein n=1 Tax=Onchocerca flexuosa TaxID=387005 RepID=A0A183H1D5_9BILA|nr:unnamed protein product [Onchocerca flexuosa]